MIATAVSIRFGQIGKTSSNWLMTDDALTAGKSRKRHHHITAPDEHGQTLCLVRLFATLEFLEWSIFRTFNLRPKRELSNGGGT